MFWQKDAARALEAPAAISDKMLGAIAGWEGMFRNEPPWLDETTRTMGLAAGIAAEVARLVTVELESGVSGGGRAAFLNAQYQRALARLRPQLEYAAAGGGMVMKPYVANGRIEVDFVRAGAFLPTGFDSLGHMTGAVFMEQQRRGREIYTRLERHSLEPEGYVVENKAYCSRSEGLLGRPVALTAVEAWAGLARRVCIRQKDGAPFTRPLFVYFKMPFANHLEEGCPLGVSVYGRAAGLMEEADRQYSRILWEYEGSELAVDASLGALQPAPAANGQRPSLRLPKGKRRLFRELRLDKGEAGDLYSVFSPAIRDGALFNGLNNLLKRIEFACYLSYGTLSDPQNVDRTAEEIKMSKQRSYSAVCEVQRALEEALRSLVEAMDATADLYALAPAGDYGVNFVWGDSVTTDADKEREQMRQDCRDGAAQWWEYRVRFYGESEEEAKRALGE